MHEGGIVKAALCEEDGPPVIARFLRGDGSDVRVVYRRHDRIKVQIAKLRRVPLGVTAVFCRNFRERIFAEGVAVGKREGRDGLIIGDKAQREGLHRVRNAVEREHVVIGDRLGEAGVAPAVNAGERVGNEEVFEIFAGVRAGHRAVILLCVADVHHAHAPGHGAAGAGQRLGNTGTDDAPGVLCAGNGAFGPARAHRRARETGDAACVAAVFARHIAEAAAGGDDAEILPSGDAAGTAAPRIDAAGVFTACEDGLHLILALIFCGEIGGNVVLGIVFVFNGHRTGDAADIDIAADIGIVPAAGDLAEPDELNVYGRGIRENVAVCGADGKNGIEHRLGELVELLVDRADIVRDCSGRAGYRAVEQGELAADAVYGGGQPTEIGRCDDLHTAGDGTALGMAAVNVHIERQDADVHIETGVPVRFAVELTGAADADADIARLVYRVADIPGHFIEPGGNSSRAALRVVGRFIDELAELLELLLHFRKRAVFHIQL